MCHARRLPVVAFTLSIAVLFVAAAPLKADCPSTAPVIPNFHTDSYTATTWVMAWDPPANASAGAVYEVLGNTGGTYCTTPGTYTVLATTTSTSYNASLSTQDTIYRYYVRLKSDPCTMTSFYYITDTFTTPPSKPPTPTVTAGPSSATVTFSYSDGKSYGVLVDRAPLGGNFVFAGRATTCGSDPKTVTDNGDSGKGLPGGIYRYRLRVYNHATSFGTSPQPVSDAVTVTVGTPPAPQILSFAVSPPTIRAGQSATLSWNVQGATSVLIDQGVGTQPTSGTIAVSPKTTTSYTLMAMAGSVSSTATVTVNVITAPIVVVSTFPSAMLQAEGVGGATTNFTLSNAGGTSTKVTLTQSGTFFLLTPTSFTLNVGASQVITVTASAQSSGAFEGSASPSGNGVAAGLQIPIKLLSTSPPAGAVTAKPTANRVDVAGDSGTSPSGSVSFTNSGTGTLTGILVSDVPWLIPQSGVVTIPPGATVSLSFTIDRAMRPDADALLGSAAGNLSLVYLNTTAGKTGTLETTSPSVSIVSVVDTVKLAVTSGTAPPPLSPGEIALFVPGVGHVVGSVGTFISDVSVLNPPGNVSIKDIKMFLTPRTFSTGTQQSTSLPPLGGSTVSLADVAKNVFGNDAQVGSLQIRSASAGKLSVSANIFNSSNPAGTYGTAVPTFRSDRGVGPGDRLVLTGLRSDSSSHTNLFIQETSGTGVLVQTDFLSADGSTMTTRTDQVGAFGLTENDRVVPAGAVAAIVSNISSGTGKFLAYATPVDEASGDNWSVVDWSRQYGYSGSDPVIIPVAGVLRGANNTFFRTDVAITNTDTTQGSGTLRFYPRSGTPTDKQITFGARQTNIISNVIGGLFGAADGSIGYLLFTPVTGTFVITSRTYTTVAEKVATFGTGVPTLAAADSMAAGALRAIGSLEDATVATISAARPATFRTNFGLLETSGSSVTVRVTLRFTYPAGTKVSAIGSASQDFTLAPYQFLQLGGIAGQILGSANRATLGDLRGMEADFQVISGSGAVAIYTSSTDNGTGDSILRTE